MKTGTTFSRSARPILVGLILMLTTAPPTGAQDSGDPGWRIVPYVGEYAIDDDDGIDFANGSGAGMKLGRVVGIGIDFDAPLPFIGFRVSYDRTFGSTLQGGGGSADARVRSLSLDFRLQPVPATWPVRPFVFVGAERLDFEFDDARDIAFSIDDQSQMARRFGYGVDFEVLGGSFRAEGVHRNYLPEHATNPSITNGNFAILAGVRIAVE